VVVDLIKLNFSALLNQIAMSNKDQDTKAKKLETDAPLSEKDEVKKAEHRLNKVQKGMKDSVKSDLKNREK
jgi:hypothetical protein